ncbi:MAG TPA: hypothetical protein VF061_07990 [Gemmatimonadales bacterium]
MPNPLSPDPTLRPTSGPSPRRRPARPAAWIRARQTRVAGLLLLAALAGAGCSDQTAPTSPDTVDAPVSGGAADAKRTTFISYLLTNPTVFANSTYGADVSVKYELTNPGGKTSGLHIHGELRQGSVTQSSDYTKIECGEVPGTIGHGACGASTLMHIPPGSFQHGPAQFTLRLSNLKDNGATTVASRTVDVYIVLF